MNRIDTLILLLSICLAASLFYLTFRPDIAGTFALITPPTQSTQSYRLDQDRLIQVNGPLGHTTLEIRAGKIRFSESPCTNKVCIHSGWHEQVGDFAACLPNQIALSISGHIPAYDSMSY